MAQTDPIAELEKSGEKITTITVTDEIARLILTERNFENQRDMDPVHVANIADVMQSGEWIGKSMLTFARNGDGILRQVDGQHRLRGFLEYARRSEDTPTMDFTIQVIDEDMREAYAQLDSLAKKRASNVIGAALQLPVPGVLLKNALSAASWALRYTAYSRETELEIGERIVKKTTMVPYRECRRYIGERRDAFQRLGEEVLAGMKTKDSVVKTVLRSPRVMPVCIETLHLGGEEAAEFWQPRGRRIGSNRAPHVEGAIHIEAARGPARVCQPQGAHGCSGLAQPRQGQLSDCPASLEADRSDDRGG